jgi:hypothetical protein
MTDVTHDDAKREVGKSTQQVVARPIASLSYKTYHPGLLDDTEQAETIDPVGRREVGQLLTVLAAQNSSRSTDDEGDRPGMSGVFGNGIPSGHGVRTLHDSDGGHVDGEERRFPPAFVGRFHGTRQEHPIGHSRCHHGGCGLRGGGVTGRRRRRRRGGRPGGNRARRHQQEGDGREGSEPACVRSRGRRSSKTGTGRNQKRSHRPRWG